MASRPRDSRADADRSFERLYTGHRREVYRAALRALGNADDAEDVTQAAFVDAYRAMLRGSRPSAPRAWLLAIAENVRRRRFRAAGRRPREEPLGADVASSDLSHEQADVVRRALAALPAQQREVFLLREVSGLSYGEIAERLDSTVASVQMLLFRARQALRAELDPPSVAPRRRVLGLQLPAWLVQLAGRADPHVLTPRGAGTVGAALLAVTGLTAGALHVQQGDEPRPRAVVREAPPTAPPASSPPVARPAVAPAPAPAPVAAPPRRTAAAPPAPSSTPPAPAASEPATVAPPPPAPVARVPVTLVAPPAPTVADVPVPDLPSPAPAVPLPPPVLLPVPPLPPVPAVPAVPSGLPLPPPPLPEPPLPPSPPLPGS